MPIWQAGRFSIDLTVPRVMGIVNVTPDSFSDGGAYASPTKAIQHCERLIQEGADILDIGAESTRPGAQPLSLQEEIERLAPVIRAAVAMQIPISVDTYKPEVMRHVLDMGADIINDVKALQSPGALACVAAHPNCGVCLMHMQGDPASMQQQPRYDDIVMEVIDFFKKRLQAVLAQGVSASRIIVDPGIGFGKTVEHNLALLPGQVSLLALGYPVLAGWSRKSTLGYLTGREVTDRLASSVAAALAAVVYGAKIIRVHDVAATVDALKVWAAAGLAPGAIKGNK
jgi:dihydropteroate synthase